MPNRLVVDTRVSRRVRSGQLREHSSCRQGSMHACSEVVACICTNLIWIAKKFTHPWQPADGFDADVLDSSLQSE